MKTIKIHGDEWEIEYVKAMLASVRKQRFEKAEWHPRDALVRNDGSRATIYTGQPFDSAQYQIGKGAWDHDHCEVCNWTFHGSATPANITGYFNGYNWLCTECYERFIEGNELEEPDGGGK